MTRKQLIGHVALAIWLAAATQTSADNVTDVTGVSLSASSSGVASHQHSAPISQSSPASLETLATNFDALDPQEKTTLVKQLTGGRKVDFAIASKLAKMYLKASAEDKAVMRRLYGTFCGDDCATKSCAVKVKRSDGSVEDGNEHLQKRCE